MINRQYPIGKFELGKTYTFAETQQHISIIQSLPQKLRETTTQFTAKEWATPYRESGWTALQVVHHLADSHMNALIRIKLALTEENPAIRPYQEDKWAILPDMSLPAEVSLQLLEALHLRWVTLLQALQVSDFAKTYFHPESKHIFTIAEGTAMYAWHSEHHLAHVKLVV